jgi:hypothetical protein
MNTSLSISPLANVPLAKLPENPIQINQQIRFDYQDWEKVLDQRRKWQNLQYETQWNKLTTKPYSKDEMLLNFISLQAMDLFDQLFEKVKEKSGPVYQENFTFFYSFFSEIADHLISNASDTLLRCMLKKKSTNYEAILEIRLLFQNGSLKIEIEDNGEGIPFDVESKIFKEQVTTKDTQHDIKHYGGVGLGLMNVNLFKENLKGDSGFLNKGNDQGAIFWFEASLDNCMMVFKSESYQRHLMKNYNVF